MKKLKFVCTSVLIALCMFIGEAHATETVVYPIGPLATYQMALSHRHHMPWFIRPRIVRKDRS